MTFEEAFAYAKRLQEDVNIMEDDEGVFHVIRSFGVKHFSQHYKTVTEIRITQQITGRQA